MSRTCIAFLLYFVVLACGGVVRADDPPASPPDPSEDPFEIVVQRPLSAETWPLWREVYLRMFFEDGLDPGREEDFYERLWAFIGTMAAASGGSLSGEFADDPIAWNILASSYFYNTDWTGGAATAEASLERAKEACRRAIALGDPRAIASYSLAAILINRERLRSLDTSSTGDGDRRLDEAESLLRKAERVSPGANVDLWRGYIAQLRGDADRAVVLFRRATEMHPRSSQSAFAYLMVAMPTADPSAHVTDLTRLYAERFPQDAGIQAIHAVALYRDGHFIEAADTLQHARALDPQAALFLGDEVEKAIEQGRDLTPGVVAGIEAMKAERYDEAANALRRAREEDPGNPLTARLLARAIVHQLIGAGTRSDRSNAVAAVGEVGELCRRFPGEADVHAAHAIALHVVGRDVEAARALDRVQELGARPEEFIDPESIRAIRESAEIDRSNRFWRLIAVGAVGGAAAWIAAMFALGAVLAVCIPRVPGLPVSAGQSRSRREVWLERFYLVMLSLGLLVFYASVPVVALGLLAVTLAIFGFLLVLRVIHYGVLYRGFWATWNVLRCAFMGPNRGVLGIEATKDKHPRLFDTLRAVAEHLQTRPVDTVYLTPSSSISVYQDGSGPFGLLGGRRRVLQIGISTLPLLTRGEFKAILAHEYGHFTHRDPFYGRFIFQVSASLASSLEVMSAAGGILNYVNPFYWFWWLYLRAYTLLSTGFSRSREFLADRRAAIAYGKQAFVSGLTKVSVDGVLFESTVYANVRDMLSQRKMFTNVFDAFRQFREGSEIVESRERMLEEIRRTAPRWFDTHPTFSERIAAVADFPDVAPDADSGPAVELLSDHQAVEAELTKLLTSYIHQFSGDVWDLPQDSAGDGY